MEDLSYGVIFMDCSMPILDGFESTDRIRKYLTSTGSDTPQPRIIALTGHTEKEYI